MSCSIRCMIFLSLLRTRQTSLIFLRKNLPKNFSYVAEGLRSISGFWLCFSFECLLCLLMLLSVSLTISRLLLLSVILSLVLALALNFMAAFEPWILWCSLSLMMFI